MASRAPIDWQEPVASLPGMTPYQAPSPETGFLDNFRASQEEMEIAGNIGSSDRNLAEAYRPVLDALDSANARYQGRTYMGTAPMHFLNPGNLTEDPLTNGYANVPGRSRMRAMIFEEVRRQRQRDPAFLTGVPDNPDEFESQANQRTRARLQGIRQTQAGASVLGRIGGFIGGVAGSFEDPVNLATLPIGGAETTFVRQIGRAAIENMIVEAISQPQIVQNYAALGEDQTLGDSAQSVLMAGVAGGAFHAGARAVSEVGGRTLGPLYDNLVEGVFDSLPEDLQRRWADSATLSDHLLVDILHATVPQEHWTPDLRAAVNVVTRDAEIDGASPFERNRAGDEAHGASLAGSLQRIVDGAAPIVAPAPPREAAVAIVQPAPATSAPGNFDHWWNAGIIRNEGGTGPHGEFLTSPAGAIGPAQVWPPTAPYAARLAGLPFDNHRYRTDPAYNIALGQAYYREMLRQFNGDPAVAAAAYNAGAGSARTGRGVRGAMARAERAGEPANWEHYLPRETQGYIRDFRRRIGQPDTRVAEVAPVARPVTTGDADTADLEVRLAELEQDAARADGGSPVERAEAPSLRRDLFADDAEWARAQEAVYRQHNDVPEEPHDYAGVVYHGTNREFEQFETMSAMRNDGGPVEVTPQAHFFSEGQDSAMRFAVDRSRIDAELRGLDAGTPRVSAHRLRIEQPLDFTLTHADAPWLAENGFPNWRAFDEPNPMMAEEIEFLTDHRIENWQDVQRMLDDPVAVAALRADGYDAVRLREDDGSASWAVFDPKRISPASAPPRLRRHSPATRQQVSADALAANLKPSVAALAQFDEPMGVGAKAQLESLEHDLIADLEKTPGLRERPFIVDAVGESATLDAILQELDADKAAAAALRGCL